MRLNCDLIAIRSRHFVAFRQLRIFIRISMSDISQQIGRTCFIYKEGMLFLVDMLYFGTQFKS